MYLILRRLYRLLVHLSWPALVVSLLALFAVSWIIIRASEGPEAKIADPGVFWWYFIVTATTVGYGDFSPATLGGRIGGVIIMFGGIGIMAGVLGKAVEAVATYTERRKKGMTKLDCTNHIIIFGHRKETRQLISEIRGDATDKHAIVLCSSSASENPFPDEVEFVSGELGSDDVMVRANVAEADAVIIHGHSDHQTLAVGIAVSAFARKDAVIVAHFTDESYAINLKRVVPRAQCIGAISVQLMVQAMQDPGSQKVIEVLTSNLDTDATQFRMVLPEDFPPIQFGDLYLGLKREFNAIPLGIATDADCNSRPDLVTEDSVWVEPGMALYYASAARLQDPNWSRLDRYRTTPAVLSTELRA